MLKWKVNRTIDLTRDAPAVERLKALATLSTRIAHELRISVQESKKDADLRGLTAKLSVILPDKSSLMDAFDGKIDGSAAVMTLPDICYSQTGEVRGVLYLADDSGGLLPIYAFVLLNFADLTDNFVDTANVVPSISELLSQMQTMREVTTAAQTATRNANTAASNAQTQAEAAKDAADTANAAAKKLSGVSVEMTMLESGSDPSGSVTQTEESTTFHLKIPIGPTGPKGDTGATPEITVEVATGEPGTEATASVSGTAENPVIRLTIPRGDIGPDGGMKEEDLLETLTRWGMISAIVDASGAYLVDASGAALTW